MGTYNLHGKLIYILSAMIF